MSSRLTQSWVSMSHAMTPQSFPRRARSALFQVLRTAFRAVPMSEPTRDRLRSHFLRTFPTVRPLPQQGQFQPGVERRRRVRADERCIGYVEYSEEPLPDPMPATLVAFYLPQFHTIPENDEWWGKGFTEWRNVTRALPQFEGHLQPRLPGDLGFYDLRNPQVMRDQAKLAKTYGLSAFCFYFYWFGGKTLLEEPLRNWLTDKSIDFKYCLCWANENWTRRWDGRDDEVLIAQRHSPEDDIAFIEYIADYLRDPRYLRVDGKPMLLLYRPMLLPDPKATARQWRTWCRKNGVGEIYLAYVQSFEKPDPKLLGFDAAVQFPPNTAAGIDVSATRSVENPAYRGTVLDWRSLPDSFKQAKDAGASLHAAVNCGWDNEPRQPGRGRTWLWSSPHRYCEWLRSCIFTSGYTRPTVFINGWNEWAEGAVLESDARRGFCWLQATRAALLPVQPLAERPCAVIHAWYPEIIPELLDSMGVRAFPWKIILTTGVGMASCVEHEIRRYGATDLVADITEHPNRGRDILPFLKVAAQLLSAGHTSVLKLHTKRSPHRPDGARWRGELTRALVHGGGRFSWNQMQSCLDVGLIAPAGHLQPMSYFYGANRERVTRLANTLNISDIDDRRFASGSMYWIRLSAIEQILFDALADSDFEDEQGQVDGTLAHAIERIIAPLVECNGFRVKEIGQGFGGAGYRAPTKIT
ncbi:MAG: hypothetical protein EPO46_09480 [Lysobacter sp.]|nr:MAG: hypothetical protein EPO46_09480 [Lysobacter sp.]